MLAQEGALGELVQQHLMSQRKFSQLARHNSRGRPSLKGKNENNDRSPKTPTKRRRSGGGSGRKKHRKRK
jgi:hypothetical protein